MRTQSPGLVAGVTGARGCFCIKSRLLSTDPGHKVRGYEGDPSIHSVSASSGKIGRRMCAKANLARFTDPSPGVSTSMWCFVIGR